MQKTEDKRKIYLYLIIKETTTISLIINLSVFLHTEPKMGK